MTAELKAARFVQTALVVIRENLPVQDQGGSVGEVGEIGKLLLKWQKEINAIENAANAEGMIERAEPVEVEIRWADMQPGDRVRHRNGQWLTVDATAPVKDEDKLAVRVENEAGVAQVLTGGKGFPVTVQRGDIGKAIDMFTAAGITLEVIR